MHDELFFKLYDRLPKEMTFIRELLLSSLWRANAGEETFRRSKKDEIKSEVFRIAEPTATEAMKAASKAE